MLPKDPKTTPAKSKEELQRLLQEALRKKRPHKLRLALGTILLLGTALLLIWLFSSRGEEPPLVVVAFDDLGPTGRETRLHGCLEGPPDVRAHLAGKDMLFVDAQALLPPGQRPKEVAAATGPNGEVSCAWTFPAAAGEGSFLLRQVGDKFRPGVEDRARFFLVPKGVPLCLVQIDATLTRANELAWRKDSIQEIDVMAGAAEALAEIHAKGFEIVYLALAADRPTLYQKMRGWVRHRNAQGTTPLPNGAVLSRFTLPRADRDSRPWQKTAELLRAQFAPPEQKDAAQHMVIAGTIEVAQQVHAPGMRTIYLGAGEDVPAGVQRVPGWDDIRRLLDN